MKARIYKSTGTWYNAKGEDGHFYQCRIKGKLKLDREITSTNPIAVGDIVVLEKEIGTAYSAMICAIEKRNNYLIRSSPHNKRQKHIVAANLDQSVLLATIKDPRTSTGFIDRFLVSSEAYHIPAVLVFNKADLYDAEDLQYIDFLKEIYTACGYPVYLIAAEKEQGLDIFKTLLKDKISLLSGHSGVGKSTLLNRLLPHVEAATQDVSDWSGKGMHTTTFAEMYDLPEGGSLIDTPGIRELGIFQMQRAELSGYFPEMKALAGQCKYNNCSHFNEPQCAVKEAVRSGKISEERYVNYANIYDSINDKHYE
ncbi:MAG: ribosome small subunit-dependent GTPase A [Chitinophagaceae bacterium]|nr:ribosome small subunit-dependent GTPase A [Chitinophagaceae bacterium]